MKNKILFSNIRTEKDVKCFGMTLVRRGSSLALPEEETLSRKEAERMEKLARAGVAAALAKAYGAEKARELCVEGKGEASLDGIRLPKKKESELPAVWFYLSLREEPGSPEEIVCLHNALLSQKNGEAAERRLKKGMGPDAAAAFLHAVRAARIRRDELEDPEDVKALCAAAGTAAARDVFLAGWKD